MAGNRQPLLLNSYSNEGIFVYSVSPSNEPAPEIRLSPDPVARFLNDDEATAVVAVAVSGGGTTLLSLLPNSRHTAVLDIGTQPQQASATPGPRLRDRKLRPVMLPVGDDTVVVMDTILRGGGCCCFEELRRVPGGGGWRADPLPNPPPVAGWQYLPTPMEEEEEDDDDGGCGYRYIGLPYVTAYFAIGARLWVSISTYVDGDRCAYTCSLDTERGGAWREEGSWEVPLLHGRSLFVPELNLVFGFSSLPLVGCTTSYTNPAGCHHLCAVDVEARPPVVRGTWEFPVEPEEERPYEQFGSVDFL